MTKRVDYGVDGYRVIVGLLVAGGMGIAAGGVALQLGSQLLLGTLLFLLGSAALVPGPARAALRAHRQTDARALSFPDASFDVVVSTLCLHNIAQNRGKALREIARVLKPGGVAVISDLALTELYVQGLTKLGLTATRSAIVFDTFPFQRIVTARRPPTDA